MQPLASTKTYRVNEIFFSPQGEGARQGQDSVFVRFSGCNLRCDIEPGPRSPGGFACDTEFLSGVRLNCREILAAAGLIWRSDSPKWVVFTGGEPMLQLTGEVVSAFHDAGWKCQIETNGTRKVPDEWGMDFITVSPKVAEHALKQLTAHEVKYVRGHGQGLPRTRVKADHRFISPAFDGNETDQEALEWCKRLVRESDWEMSVQMHKVWNVR